ncbi:MAG TPA: RNA polymerase sigma factor [Thermoanaerobaculia bacterium]
MSSRDKRSDPDARKNLEGTEMPELVYSATRHRASWVERTDRDLLEGIKEGDEAALDELIARKTGPLLQLAYRILGDREEARDVVQVGFFRVWENRERFDDRWSPNTWIYRIVNNLAIDHLRSRQSRERQTEPVRQHLRQVADSRSRRHLSSLGGSEVMDIFHDLSGELTDKQRSVFLLRELEGLSSQEVAEVVGCRESTVRNHLFNARKVLRRALLERYPEYAPAGRQGGADLEARS